MEEIHYLLELDGSHKQIYQLSAEQKRAVAKAREQIQGGSVYSNQKAKDDIDQWLNT